MDNIEIIGKHIRNSIIDLAHELSKEVPMEEEELKYPLITHSMIDAAAMYTALMLKNAYDHDELKSKKEDFLHEFQSYFTETLNHQINFVLFDSANNAKPKDKCLIINLADYLSKR